jgi:hypothetical protein
VFTAPRELPRWTSNSLPYRTRKNKTLQGKLTASTEKNCFRRQKYRISGGRIKFKRKRRSLRGPLRQNTQRLKAADETITRTPATEGKTAGKIETELRRALKNLSRVSRAGPRWMQRTYAKL